MLRFFPWRNGHRVSSQMSLALPLHDRLKQQARFIWAFMRNPRKTGSICPSSAYLVAALARSVPNTTDEAQQTGLVIDLGAGTGIVTSALLKAGAAPQSVLAVECCQQLARVMQHKYPGIDVFVDDARCLGAHLDAQYPDESLRAVVSSLPFRSLPKDVAEEIAVEIRAIMQARGGILVQYSYAWWKRFPLAQYGFVPHHRFIVLRNVPPAVVEVYGLPSQ